MFNEVIEMKVDILVDLHELRQEFGVMNNTEPQPENTRTLIDMQRTLVLRDIVKTSIINANFVEVGRDIDKICLNTVEQHKRYIKEYLSSTEPDLINGVADGEFYYMNLEESTKNPGTYFLELILKRGFNNYMKENPSERLKKLLQEILGILYENNISDRDIVGYYMGLSLRSNSTFESNFMNFLGEI